MSNFKTVFLQGDLSSNLVNGKAFEKAQIIQNQRIPTASPDVITPKSPIKGITNRQQSPTEDTEAPFHALVLSKQGVNNLLGVNDMTAAQAFQNLGNQNSSVHYVNPSGTTSVNVEEGPSAVISPHFKHGSITIVDNNLMNLNPMMRPGSSQNKDIKAAISSKRTGSAKSGCNVPPLDLNSQKDLSVHISQKDAAGRSVQGSNSAEPGMARASVMPTDHDQSPLAPKGSESLSKALHPLDKMIENSRDQVDHRLYVGSKTLNKVNVNEQTKVAQVSPVTTKLNVQGKMIPTKLGALNTQGTRESNLNSIQQQAGVRGSINSYSKGELQSCISQTHSQMMKMMHTYEDYGKRLQQIDQTSIGNMLGSQRGIDLLNSYRHTFKGEQSLEGMKQYSSRSLSAEPNEFNLLSYLLRPEVYYAQQKARKIQDERIFKRKDLIDVGHVFKKELSIEDDERRILAVFDKLFSIIFELDFSQGVMEPERRAYTPNQKQKQHLNALKSKLKRIILTDKNLCHFHRALVDEGKAGQNSNIPIVIESMATKLKKQNGSQMIEVIMYELSKYFDERGQIKIVKMSSPKNMENTDLTHSLEEHNSVQKVHQEFKPKYKILKGKIFEAVQVREHTFGQTQNWQSVSEESKYMVQLQMPNSQSNLNINDLSSAHNQVSRHVRSPIITSHAINDTSLENFEKLHPFGINCDIKLRKQNNVIYQLNQKSHTQHVLNDYKPVMRDNDQIYKSYNNSNPQVNTLSHRQQELTIKSPDQFQECGATTFQETTQSPLKSPKLHLQESLMNREAYPTYQVKVHQTQPKITSNEIEINQHKVTVKKSAAQKLSQKLDKNQKSRFKLNSKDAQILQAIDMLSTGQNFKASLNSVQQNINRNPFELALVGKKAAPNVMKIPVTVNTPESSNFAENQLQVMEELSGAIAEQDKINDTEKKPQEMNQSDIMTEKAGIRIMSNFDGNGRAVPVTSTTPLDIEAGLQLNYQSSSKHHTANRKDTGRDFMPKSAKPKSSTNLPENDLVKESTDIQQNTSDITQQRVISRQLMIDKSKLSSHSAEKKSIKHSADRESVTTSQRRKISLTGKPHSPEILDFVEEENLLRPSGGERPYETQDVKVKRGLNLSNSLQEICRNLNESEITPNIDNRVTRNEEIVKGIGSYVETEGFISKSNVAISPLPDKGGEIRGIQVESKNQVILSKARIDTADSGDNIRVSESNALPTPHRHKKTESLIDMVTSAPAIKQNATNNFNIRKLKSAQATTRTNKWSTTRTPAGQILKNYKKTQKDNRKSMVQSLNNNRLNVFNQHQEKVKKLTPLTSRQSHLNQMMFLRSQRKVEPISEGTNLGLNLSNTQGSALKDDIENPISVIVSNNDSAAALQYEHQEYLTPIGPLPTSSESIQMMQTVPTILGRLSHEYIKHPYEQQMKKMPLSSANLGQHQNMITSNQRLVKKQNTSLAAPTYNSNKSESTAKKMPSRDHYIGGGSFGILSFPNNPAANNAIQEYIRKETTSSKSGEEVIATDQNNQTNIEGTNSNFNSNENIKIVHEAGDKPTQSSIDKTKEDPHMLAPYNFSDTAQNIEFNLTNSHMDNTQQQMSKDDNIRYIPIQGQEPEQHLTQAQKSELEQMILDHINKSIVSKENIQNILDTKNHYKLIKAVDANYMQQAVFNKYAKTFAERENINTDPDQVLKDYKEKTLKLYMGVSAYFNHQYKKDINYNHPTTSGFFNLISRQSVNRDQPSRDDNRSGMSAKLNPKDHLEQIGDDVQKSLRVHGRDSGLSLGVERDESQNLVVTGSAKKISHGNKDRFVKSRGSSQMPQYNETSLNQESKVYNTFSQVAQDNALNFNIQIKYKVPPLGLQSQTGSNNTNPIQQQQQNPQPVVPPLKQFDQVKSLHEKEKLARIRTAQNRAVIPRQHSAAVNKVQSQIIRKPKSVNIQQSGTAGAYTNTNQSNANIKFSPTHKNQQQYALTIQSLKAPEQQKPTTVYRKNAGQRKLIDKMETESLQLGLKPGSGSPSIDARKPVTSLETSIQVRVADSRIENEKTSNTQEMQIVSNLLAGLNTMQPDNEGLIDRKTRLNNLASKEPFDTTKVLKQTLKSSQIFEVNMPISTKSPGSSGAATLSKKQSYPKSSSGLKMVSPDINM